MADPLQRSNAFDAASGVKSVALHDLSAPLCLRARFHRGMQEKRCLSSSWMHVPNTLSGSGLML